MNVLPIIRWGLELVGRVLGYFANKKLTDLQSRRASLERESVIAQSNGDVNALRRIRAEIDEVDIRISTITDK